MKKSASCFLGALLGLLAAGATAVAANSPPLAGAWNISAKGKAQSSGELLFRMTPLEGSDPVEITVSVLSGTNDLNVARAIRNAMSAQLRADRFNVDLGEGAQVIVSDQAGQPSFSLELLQADVENLQVLVSGAPVGAVPAVAPAGGPPEPQPSAPAESPPENAPPPASPGAAPAPPASSAPAAPPASAPASPGASAPPPPAAGASGSAAPPPQ